MGIRSLMFILATAGCASRPLGEALRGATAPLSTPAPSGNPFYYSKAYEASARASGIFFASATVASKPDGSMQVFTTLSIRNRKSPRLSTDMLRALERVTSEIRPKYRNDLRIAFPYLGSRRQFFAMFLQQDTQRHILNLCRSDPAWNCKHRCSGEIDFDNQVLTITTFRDASCMDNTPYWKP